MLATDNPYNNLFREDPTADDDFNGPEAELDADELTGTRCFVVFCIVTIVVVIIVV